MPFKPILLTIVRPPLLQDALLKEALLPHLMTHELAVDFICQLHLIEQEKP